MLEAQADPTLYVRNTEATSYGSGERPKTGKERPVPLVPPAVALLRRLQAERPNEDDDAPVLLTPQADRGVRPFLGHTLSRAFEEYAKQANLPASLTFHSLRKTCGTWRLNNGVERALVQRVLGHERITMTDASYTNVWTGRSGASSTRRSKTRRSRTRCRVRGRGLQPADKKRHEPERSGSRGAESRAEGARCGLTRGGRGGPIHFMFRS